MPPDKVHVGCQVGKVYRIAVRENAEAFALLGVLLKQGGEETLEESTARHSSPKAWVIAVIPVPDAFAPLPTQSELGMNIDAKWGLPSCMRRLAPQTTPLQILNLAEVGNTASADHLPTAPPPALLSRWIPGGPCGQKSIAVCASVA